MKKTPTATLLIAVLLVVGCSDRSAEMSFGGSTGAASEPTPGAPASSTTGPETTVDTGTLDSAIGAEPEVVLRVEGDAGVTFSGLCDVGEEETVLGGPSVPKRYAFDPDGEQLSCRIQKQDSSDGDLKVTLLAGDSTQSVQQTNSPDSTINVSYNGG